MLQKISDILRISENLKIGFWEVVRTGFVSPVHPDPFPVFTSVAACVQGSAKAAHTVGILCHLALWCPPPISTATPTENQPPTLCHVPWMPSQSLGLWPWVASWLSYGWISMSYKSAPPARCTPVLPALPPFCLIQGLALLFLNSFLLAMSVLSSQQSGNWI